MNNLFYDGFNSKLIETAFFEGFLEIPILEAPKEIVIPSVAMKNVFNEMYPLDCSKKTRMALNTKARNGQFVGSKAPYGYKKSEKDKHILEIDENVADK